ncbi:MAG TPA: PolC-type DNA polymerase III [Bacilli bacterium]|jgi:DNA polymerase-3 subunit alpha (Gram-positive type)|nr:PolC-type DNA polymerase III [Bacilli bacterium]
MNKEKWLELLKQANFNIIDEVKDGEILEVLINSASKALTLSVQLPKLVPLRLVERMSNHLQGFLKESVGVESINFLWSYQSQTYETSLIEEYYRKAINLAQKNRKLAGVLKEYKYRIGDNKIVVMVATPTDEGLAKEALQIVRDFFNSHGLNAVHLETCVSDSETCLKDVLENEIQLREQLRDAKSYEQQKQQIHLRNAYEEKAVYKPKRSSTPVHIPLKELPVTSMEAVEFRQKNGTDKVVIEGVIFKAESRKVKGYLIFEGFITDYEDSIMVKRFYKPYEAEFFEQDLKNGIRVRVTGNLQYDTFAKEVVIMASEITKLGLDATHIRFDEAPERRVELHAHTKMSTLDSVLDVDKYVETAAKFQHRAVAVTDHANCHVLPAFFNACQKHKIKPIAGVEGNFIDDSRLNVTLTVEDRDLLDATFVVFDIETTGFSVNFNEIIEIGAVKIKNGIQLDTFSTFVRPSRKISRKISELTNISNEDVAKAPAIEEVLPKFVEFIGDSILVAHNATFDTGFIYYAMKQLGIYQKDFPCIDTLQLARVLYNERIKRFNLEAVAKELKVEIVDHHRAIADARTTSHIFMKMLGDLTDHHVYNYRDINAMVDEDSIFKYIIPTHINILVKNKQGLKNFYHLISDSHTTHFYKEPRLLKSKINQYREGLLVGSGCSNGEIFTFAYEKSYEEFLERARYYDYLEVQPPECYVHLIEKYDEPEIEEFIKTTIKTIIKAGKELNIPVIATGDVHQLEKDETVYRKIFIRVPRPGGGLHEMFGIENVPNMYFRTTSEMLEAFSFLDAEDAYRIVVTETNRICDAIVEIELFPKQLFTPNDDFMARFGTPSMAEAVRNLTYSRALEIYGMTAESGETVLPSFIEDRIKQELDSIIGNGYASIYYISHILVKNSVENGYIVGSRGSVGSSFVATMMGITEVNPLKPHYVCPNCRFSVFKSENAENAQRRKELPIEAQEAFETVTTGQDLPECDCPRCHTKLNRDGVDIPFETFLGIKGKEAKVPDIDLNFSGEYQEKAHLFCRDIFGVDNAFRGGTIGTVAEKTAFGFVKGYLEDSGRLARSAEVERLAQALIGSKRTTGQHPGGIILIPNTIEYADIIPIQYPADDPNSTWRTSHYDYHSFEKNLLKMDILGHDDPTMIKHLMDFVHQYPDRFPFSRIEDIPILDKDVLALFSTKEVLGLKGLDEDPFPSGTIGIPEFGTNFVRTMLKDVQPKTFSDIVRISGLSHGNDVWAGNFKELVLGLDESFPQIPFQEVIACRDDIMTYLINQGLTPLDAFLIMERVRKGKGLRPEDERLMRQHRVPDWYIESCNKIKYMFPKAHAVAYVIMALRIAWFKVHRPIYYYAAYFSRRASAFDVEVFASGKNAIRNKLQQIATKINNRTASNKEIALFDELQIALEMVLRGFTFHQVNIFTSDATNFVLTEDHRGLIMPYVAVESLGQAAAVSIVEARKERPFTSMRDVMERTKINKTLFNRLKVLGAFEGLPDDEHRSLFENQ